MVHPGLAACMRVSGGFLDDSWHLTAANVLSGSLPLTHLSKTPCKLPQWSASLPASMLNSPAGSIDSRSMECWSTLSEDIPDWGSAPSLEGDTKEASQSSKSLRPCPYVRKMSKRSLFPMPTNHLGLFGNACDQEEDVIGAKLPLSSPTATLPQPKTCKSVTVDAGFPSESATLTGIYAEGGVIGTAYFIAGAAFGISAGVWSIISSAHVHGSNFGGARMLASA